MTKQLIARTEYFGYTVFDPQEFSHRFILTSQWDAFSSMNKTTLKDTTNRHITHGILKSPLRVYIDMTRKCNLACSTCVNDSRYPMNNEMNFEEFDKTIDKLKTSEVFEIKFTGGEVTTFLDGISL